MLAAHDTAQQFSSLFHVYAVVAAAVVAAVFAAVAVTVIRFRRRDDRPPSGRTGAPTVEAAYVVLLAVIALGLLAATFRTENREDSLSERTGLRVDVTAYQWSWRFRYPDSGVVVDGGAVAARRHGTPTLVVPTGTVVRFSLRSADVLHSFFIPDLRFKRYAFPGVTNHFDLQFERAGHMSGACAQFCGWDHAEMRFDVLALPPGGFRSWLERRQAA